MGTAWWFPIKDGNDYISLQKSRPECASWADGLVKGSASAALQEMAPA